MKTPKITLISPELKAEFARIGEQREVKDPIVVAKFFNPTGVATWWAIAYYPEENICFGYVTGLFEDEFGYFSIDELEELVLPPLGLRIERDLFFTPCPISKVKNELP